MLTFDVFDAFLSSFSLKILKKRSLPIINMAISKFNMVNKLGYPKKNGVNFIEIVKI